MKKYQKYYILYMNQYFCFCYLIINGLEISFGLKRAEI